MEGYQILMESKESYAFIFSQDEVSMIKAFLKAKLEVMKRERYQTFLINSGTMYMNFMSQFVNEIFAKLIEAGIPQYFNRQLFDLFPHPQELKELKVFDVDDLWFGFLIWVITCGISFSVFIIEICVFWAKKCRKVPKRVR
jgi:hypothetical protein